MASLELAPLDVVDDDDELHAASDTATTTAAALSATTLTFLDTRASPGHNVDIQRTKYPHLGDAQPYVI